MSHHDHSPLPDGPPAMIGGGPGDALVPGTPGIAHRAIAFPAAPQSRTPEVLNGSMDKSWFYHSLRRRWLLALGMGLVLSGGVAGVLWVLFPPSSSAVALFQVASEEPKLLSEVGNHTRRFEVLQNTQLALLKSYFVLQDAVRKPSISGLPTFAGVDNPVQWLDKRLVVTFPRESEVLQISISGDENPEDLRQIVDAVARAYEDKVVYDNRKRKLSTREVLSKAMGKMSEEIRSKMVNYRDLAKEIGASDASQGNSEARLLMSDVLQASREQVTLKSKLTELGIGFEIYRRQLKDPQLREQQIDEAVSADPSIYAMQQQVMYLDYQIRDMRARVRNGSSPAIKRLLGQRQVLQQEIAQYRQELKQQMEFEQDSAPDIALRQATDAYRIQGGVLNQQISALEEEIQEKKDKLLAMDEKSVELEILRAELEQLQAIASDMALKIESWDIELEAPERIQKLQEAQITPGINSMQRYLIVGFGGVATFALCCFGVAYLEFRNRRLNGPGQVDEGLGIRVVGTLPSLSSRRLLDPNHPVVAQLTESIDGVRTLLMHDSTSKPRQLVLVTSAATLEGRTTVASQLAASLARAGRRTLLVDGDLRRPALHSLFDVPLEDGLCEVVRAEVDVADVIRPTHAEGLWLLTAGYCDVDAIQALATDQLQPIFEKLRSDYDFIIIDGAPVLGLSDSLLFGQYCDGALLSVLRDHSEVPKIYQAAELLRSVGIRMIGTVVNGVPTKSDRRVTQLRLSAPKADRVLQTS